MPLPRHLKDKIGLDTSTSSKPKETKKKLKRLDLTFTEDGKIVDNTMGGTEFRREQDFVEKAADDIPVPSESVGKEISPSSLHLTLHDMRQIVGKGGVTGKHVGGSNEARTVEDEVIHKLEKKKQSPDTK